LPLLGPTVGYLRLTGSEYRSGDIVPASEQIRFGGARTLRGYQEDAFRGTLVAWVNAEYRLISGKSRVFAFCDFGAFQRLETSGWVRGTRWGYGFGLRIDTKAGLFGIDYGLGEGDGVMRGKVHVGLVNRF
jgi:outer membrane protein assembly factor BamA